MTALTIANAYDDHELVQVITDRASSLRAVVAVHSTAAGPAMGGIRRQDYASLDDAIVDALRLSSAMTAKNIVAGLPLGGGKAVVIDGGEQADPDQLAALGEAIDRLGGQYVGAEDIGTTPDDMATIARQTRHVAGLPASLGGTGDPSPTTARTVLHACLSALAADDEAGALSGRTIGVLGVGKVGAALARGLRALGAELVVADAVTERAQDVAEELGARVASPDALLRLELDLLAPCARGAVLDGTTVGLLRSRVVCGGANNQLAEPEVAELLRDRGILYVPDFVANCGGIIHVGGAFLGWDPARVEDAVAAAIARCDELLARSRADGSCPFRAACSMAERALEQARAVV